MDQDNLDRKYMCEAMSQARLGFQQGEVPVGAVLVCDEVIIARAHNRVEAESDATKHAEILCLQEGAKLLGNWRLAKATLYSTLEPCPMCAGAMIHSRLETLVWAAPDLRCGAHGSWMNLLDTPHPIHQIKVRKGLFEAEAGELMRAFFRQRRNVK
jgi:tRNA(adenine34) deaminase